MLDPACACYEFQARLRENTSTYVHNIEMSAIDCDRALRKEGVREDGNEIRSMHTDTTGEGIAGERLSAGVSTFRVYLSPLKPTTVPFWETLKMMTLFCHTLLLITVPTG